MLNGAVYCLYILTWLQINLSFCYFRLYLDLLSYVLVVVDPKNLGIKAFLLLLIVLLVSSDLSRISFDLYLYFIRSCSTINPSISIPPNFLPSSLFTYHFSILCLEINCLIAFGQEFKEIEAKPCPIL